MLVERSREEETGMRTCPKCGYIRKPEDQAPQYECPACGIVYDKYEQHRAATEAKAATARLALAERERRKLEAEQRQAAETARKASERAQRQQSDMIAAAVKKALPRRGLGLGGLVGIVMVVGLLASVIAPSSVPAPAPNVAVSAPLRPAPVVLTPEEQVAAAEKRERDMIEAAARERRERAEAHAKELCQQRVKSEAAFPSRIDFGWFGTEAATAPGGAVSVSVNFTEKNAWGQEMPFTARCSVSAAGKLTAFAWKGR